MLALLVAASSDLVAVRLGPLALSELGWACSRGGCGVWSPVEMFTCCRWPVTCLVGVVLVWFLLVFACGRVLGWSGSCLCCVRVVGCRWLGLGSAVPLFVSCVCVPALPGVFEQSSMCGIQ